ncbi:MAG: hypothetical protein D6815_09205 [Candidatus Dadabacteria bacterium]|nr:MAG: hypothetical protein D6815_09205 [Candidatus Dadabacteria bacterium]
MERQSHTEIIEAPIEVCFETITDFEKYPDWFTGIEQAVVERADPDRCLWTVRYRLHMVVKTISYTLSYEGKRPEWLAWSLERGDVKAIEGSYAFKRLEPTRTEATCTQAVDVGFWIPGPLRRTFERTALADSVRQFKEAAEARAKE